MKRRDFIKFAAVAPLVTLSLEKPEKDIFLHYHIDRIKKRLIQESEKVQIDWFRWSGSGARLPLSRHCRLPLEQHYVKYWRIRMNAMLEDVKKRGGIKGYSIMVYGSSATIAITLPKSSQKANLAALVHLHAEYSNQTMKILNTMATYHWRGKYYETT